jgi:hypothetical protein
MSLPFLTILLLVKRAHIYMPIGSLESLKLHLRSWMMNGRGRSWSSRE